LKPESGHYTDMFFVTFDFRDGMTKYTAEIIASMRAKYSEFSIPRYYIYPARL